MWGTRYGLTASARSEGGHRRYTAEDLGALRRLHQAVIAGDDPAAAAARITGRLEGADDGSAAAPAPRRSGPGGSVLAVPGSGREARGLARAASRLDEMGAEDAVLGVLRARGTLRAWDEVVRPVLVAAGAHWQLTGEGIEIEHLLTQAVVTALVRHTGTLPDIASERPVLLAGGPRDEHVLPLHAVRAALAERGVPCRLLGPRTPMSALASAARRTRAAAVLTWLSTPDAEAVAGLAEVARAHRRVRIFLGGPGWGSGEVQPAARCVSLPDAVDRLEDAWSVATVG
jgi:hypothetical protein